MSKKFEVFMKSLLIMIEEFETNVQTEQNEQSQKLLNAISALSGINISTTDLVKQATDRVNDTDMGQLLALTIDAYNNNQSVSVTKEEMEFIISTKNSIMAILRNSIPPEITKTEEPSAAAEQTVVEVKEEKVEEKGDAPVDTGVTFQKECNIVIPADIPQGYEVFNAKAFGLSHKYSFIRHISDSDRRPGLYDRTTHAYRTPHRFAGGGYGFEINEDGKVFYIDLPSLYRVFDSPRHGYGIMEDAEVRSGDTGTVQSSENKKEMKSVEINWFADQQIPVDKYTLYENGEVFDKVHHKFIKPETFDLKDGGQTVIYRLTSGKMPIGPRKNKVKAITIRVSRKDLMERAGF